jgi:uncharacterized protein (TIGR02147 family)
MSHFMPNIYNYLNYREFLYDYYSEKKREKPAYSYQVFAQKAGFKSKSFIADVIDGEKNLSEESIFALGNAIELNESDFAYFKTLVAFNQAKTNSQKDHFFKLLVKSNKLVTARLVLSDKYEFYSCWYHNTVRELVTFVDFNDDFGLLGRHVQPAITARQAKKSVELLTKLGFIRKEGPRYVQTDPDITTGDTVSSLAVENFHLQNLNLAGESIDTCPAQHRDISCLIATLSLEQVEEIKNEVRDFRKKLVSMINGTTKDTVKGRRVYHINMQMFPTSVQTDSGSDYAVKK